MPILSRCGFRCDLCLAYKPNVEANPAYPEIVSDGWFKYFGFRIPPAEIVCDGCMNDEAILIDTSCTVRPCAISKKVDNCSQCEDYSCEKLQTRMVVLEDIQKQFQGDIPEIDYQRFIRPFENKKRLDLLRSHKADGCTGDPD